MPGFLSNASTGLRAEGWDACTSGCRVAAARSIFCTKAWKFPHPILLSGLAEGGARRAREITRALCRGCTRQRQRPDHPARHRIINAAAGFLAGGSTPSPAFPGGAQWPDGARLPADSCGGSCDCDAMGFAHPRSPASRHIPVYPSCEGPLRYRRLDGTAGKSIRESPRNWLRLRQKLRSRWPWPDRSGPINPKSRLGGRISQMQSRAPAMRERNFSEKR